MTDTPKSPTPSNPPTPAEEMESLVNSPPKPRSHSTSAGESPLSRTAAEPDVLAGMTETDDFQHLSFLHLPRFGVRPAVGQEHRLGMLGMSEGGILSGRADSPLNLLVLGSACLVMAVGLGVNIPILGWVGAIGALLTALRILAPSISRALAKLISPRQWGPVLAVLGLGVALWGLVQLTGLADRWQYQWQTMNWDAVGALGEVFGALGQILIAIVAVYVAWRQYVISKDLTIQQNTITQQQTIDSYFQGISELVLDEEGLLEDWPQERAIAEGRTAAILGSIDAAGKAKIIRFLSRSRLLTPLKRDRRLGRAIFDGVGGYEEDREHGVRVIDLGVMLAKADLSGTDLRWVDLSEANLFRANLSYCDLFKANLSRCILYEANLRGADLKGTQLFYGPVATASPRSRTDPPNYQTGAYTGAVIEGANFSQVQRLSEEQRYYCCAWGGEKTRRTIPGGCEGIPNRLESPQATAS